MKERTGMEFFRTSLAEASDLPTDLAEIVEEVFPDPWHGRKAPEYREDVVEQYLENDGSELREHGRLYSVDERRLLNAWTDVARDWNTSESNIRNCVLRMYENADSDSLGPVDEFGKTTEQFLEQLKEVEAQWETHKNSHSNN